MRVVIFFGLFYMSTAIAYAQSGDGNKVPEQKGPSSLQPYYPKETKAPKAKKKSKKSGATFESEQQYYDRMARLVKEKRKVEKEMEKPQYSNPAYFGHKRPPKRHKAGKLRFCKECGIRH
jgi:hypothetical protein